MVKLNDSQSNPRFIRLPSSRDSSKLSGQICPDIISVFTSVLNYDFNISGFFLVNNNEFLYNLKRSVGNFENFFLLSIKKQRSCVNQQFKNSIIYFQTKNTFFILSYLCCVEN